MSVLVRYRRTQERGGAETVSTPFHWFANLSNGWAAMKSFKEILSEFSEMGSKHSFELHSGQQCEGWIVSVEDDHVLFVDSAAQSAKNEIKLRFGAIHINSLLYHDDEKKCWIAARWDDGQDQWIKTVSHADEDSQEATAPKQEAALGKLSTLWKSKFRPRQVTQAPSPLQATPLAPPVV